MDSDFENFVFKRFFHFLDKWTVTLKVYVWCAAPFIPLFKIIPFGAIILIAVMVYYCFCFSGCSVGKSTLLTLLTGTHSEAASYEFTTLTCIPGIIHYNGTKIQLLDLPGIIEGASEGKGRGRQVKITLASFYRFVTSSAHVYMCIKKKNIYDIFNFFINFYMIILQVEWWCGHAQVIAVSKSSDIVLMVLDASKVSLSFSFLFSFFNFFFWGSFRVYCIFFLLRYCLFCSSQVSVPMDYIFIQTHLEFGSFKTLQIRTWIHSDLMLILEISKHSFDIVLLTKSKNTSFCDWTRWRNF